MAGEEADCQDAALAALTACLDSPGQQTAEQQNACWANLDDRMLACAPRRAQMVAPDSKHGAANGAVADPVEAAAMGAFEDGAHSSDRMVQAIEAYMACLASESSGNDRQSCVERLYADLHAAVNMAVMNDSQIHAYNSALTVLSDGLQRSDAPHKDFVCLRRLYGTAAVQLKLPILQSQIASALRYATNRIAAGACMHKAASSLRDCLESIARIADPAQREADRATCLDEFRTVAAICTCSLLASSCPTTNTPH
jgi:hypothetical protein